MSIIRIHTQSVLQCNFMSIICPFQFSQYYLPIFNFSSIICIFSISQVLFAYFQFSQYYLPIFNFPSIFCPFSIFPVLFANIQFPKYYLPIFNFPSIICLTELSSANLVSNSFEFLQHLKCAKFALSSFSWFSSTRSTWFHKIWPRYTCQLYQVYLGSDLSVWCLSLTHWERLLKLNWCDSGWWRYLQCSHHPGSIGTPPWNGPSNL